MKMMVANSAQLMRRTEHANFFMNKWIGKNDRNRRPKNTSAFVRDTLRTCGYFFSVEIHRGIDVNGRPNNKSSRE